LSNWVIEAGQEALTNFRSANVQGLLVYLAMQADQAFPVTY